MKKQLTLVPGAAADAALDPHQRKFNRLLTQIDAAKRELALWDAEVAHFTTAHHQLVKPLQGDISRLRFQLAQALDALLAARKGWTRAEAELMADVLCGNVIELADDEALTEAQREHCHRLHERHAGMTLEQARQEAMGGIKQMFESMTGLDLGDDDVTAPEDLMARAHARMTEQVQAQQAAREAAVAQRRRKPTKAAQARAQREKLDAETALQSVREVYRKLATALHPDRASDEADRSARTERMQRANQAYAANDLLALLSLQLEIEQIDSAHVARVTSERARQLNGLLGEQLKEVKDALQRRQFAFAEGFDIDPHERLSAKSLGALLQRIRGDAQVHAHHLGWELRQLESGKPAVKAWLKAIRQQRDADESMDALLELAMLQGR